MARVFSCLALERLGLWDRRRCCDSCHEDADMGYNLCERDLPGTDDYLATCCRVDVDRLGDLADLHARLVATAEE